MDHKTSVSIPAWVAPVGLIAALVVTVILQVLLLGVAVLITGDGEATIKNPPSLLSITSALAQNGAFIAIALGFTRLTAGPVTRQALALRVPNLRRAFLALCAFGLAMFVVVILLAIVGQLLGQDPQNTDRKLLEDLGVNDGTFLMVSAAFAVCVGAPIAEEVFFRGYFFQALSSKMHVGFAALLTGVVFGGMHVPNFADASAWETFAGLFTLTTLGCLLCVLVWVTQSLYPAIFVHAVNNCLAFSVALGWSWQIPLLIVVVVLLLFGLFFAIEKISFSPFRASKAPSVVE